MVIEVKDAQPFVGELFQRVFAAKPPDFPRHFVCFLNEGEGRLRVAGYAHFSRFESVWLGGGLVVDKSIYATVTKEELVGVGPNGSIGEFTVADSIRQLGDDSPVLAYIGDPRSITVNLNAGYVETHVPKIYACWKRRFAPEVERAICERVSRLAPF
jgi:hypothetical protein